MFDVAGMHVLAVVRDPTRLLLTVETAAELLACPGCGVIAVGHGRRVHRVHDAPCYAVATVVLWRKRIWRCPEPACPVGTFSETHPFAAPRAKLSARAIAWAVAALGHDDTTISALARHLGVDWHTLWAAVETAASAKVADPARLNGCVHSAWTSTCGAAVCAAATGR